MKKKLFFILFFGCIILNHYKIANSAGAELNTLLDKIETVYSGSGFSAFFYQESYVKSMNINDSASGKVFFKRPGMMRWDYDKPDKQNIITDGKQIWIYKPDENQVSVGKSPEFFSGGKGASFLADIKQLRQDFKITLEEKKASEYYMLKLIPNKKGLDIESSYLKISQSDYIVSEIITYNSYGDKTFIRLDKLTFEKNLDNSIFKFDIPKSIDILKLDE